ncbi:MAG: hypothetical protein K5778_01110 [Bacteroidaceae bacterium]|nr:hypothetical protein [Bacteroidaceae bacterium]MDO4993829.1 hypothetical protein [Bacteroidales bacterium]
MGLFNIIETAFAIKGANDLINKMKGKESKPKIDDFAPRFRGMDDFARGKKRDPLL